MIIIQPQVLVPEAELDIGKMEKLERYARVCYKSEDKMDTTTGQAGSFLKGLMKRGHESIIEHEKITVLFIIDRGISHEIVRHRIAAYSQESTRYCNYSRDRFGQEITLIEPFFFLNDQKAYELWYHSCMLAEKNYMALLAAGRSAQEARSILPNSLKTEIVVSYNIREWRHFFRLRCDMAAHPQMRQVAIPLLLLFRERFPFLFEDIAYDQTFPSEYYGQIILTDELFTPRQS
ncbi:FAD-dependent thymidylate synthase [Syntrophomonas wolfei]|uniref:FAD-dependent thymidylate synthase n=1 Tax=Syntrophomonas wolfei subsp. wolfei (strain DSM 2245B / Goettingen) TaxID=335541 RepID=Q0AUG0_SYNWW|nr:FAD-dependent thymidylate synthase [Syntrophomonas wolfei]ABI69644.1 thymidylate synthase complementing protein ThyX [Syntrophomonas wolfei subsp. wolfei str. Goettingen G311]